MGRSETASMCGRRPQGGFTRYASRFTSNGHTEAGRIKRFSVPSECFVAMSQLCKTKPIFGGPSWRKLLRKGGLWKETPPEAAKKQTQTNPNTGLRPEARSTGHETCLEQRRMDLKQAHRKSMFIRLHSWSILKNEPNFRPSQIHVNCYLTNDYGKRLRWERQKNKANFGPVKVA